MEVFTEKKKKKNRWIPVTSPTVRHSLTEKVSVWEWLEIAEVDMLTQFFMGFLWDFIGFYRIL